MLYHSEWTKLIRTLTNVIATINKKNSKGLILRRGERYPPANCQNCLPQWVKRTNKKIPKLNTTAVIASVFTIHKSELMAS